jgi:hypothetical protein
MQSSNSQACLGNSFSAAISALESPTVLSIGVLTHRNLIGAVCITQFAEANWFSLASLVARWWRVHSAPAAKENMAIPNTLATLCLMNRW